MGEKIFATPLTTSLAPSVIVSLPFSEGNVKTLLILYQILSYQGSPVSSNTVLNPHVEGLNRLKSAKLELPYQKQS